MDKEFAKFIETKEVDIEQAYVEEFTTAKSFDHLAKVKNILEKIKPEEVKLEEVPSANQAAIDAFLKKGGKITKNTPGLDKRKKFDIAAFRKSLANTVQKQKDADKKTTRRYVSGGGKKDDSTPYNSSDYVTHKDIKKFPRSLTSGLQKIISGAKIEKYEIKNSTYGKIPGMGITFPGSTTPKLMIQFDEDTSVRDPKSKKIGADPKYSEKGTDPTTYRKFQMTVWINEAATAKDRKSDKIDWYQRKEFNGKTADEVAKNTLQYLKTKVKRLANEEVEIDEVIGKVLGRAAIAGVATGAKVVKKVAKHIAKTVATAGATSIAKKQGNKEEVEMEESQSLQATMALDDAGIKSKWKKGKLHISKKDVKKAEKALSKSFRKGGEPNLYFEEISKEENEGDDPVGKSKKKSKKDVINLKPKMEEKQMKKLKELYSGLQKKRTQDQTLRKAVSDYHKEEVKEGVTALGVEYGEQEFDAKYRNDVAYPNLNVNFAKYIDEGLEGPYEISGEVYFYDRKVHMFYSVSGEDYVDEETAKDIAYRLHKDGFYKPDLGR